MGRDGVGAFGTRAFLARRHSRVHTRKLPGSPSPPPLPCPAPGSRFRGPKTGGFPSSSLLERPRGPCWGAETGREQVLAPPCRSEAQEMAARNVSLADLLGKAGSRFLIYPHVCGKGSAPPPARGLGEAALPGEGGMPAAVELQSEVAPGFPAQCEHTRPGLRASGPRGYLQNEEGTLVLCGFLHVPSPASAAAWACWRLTLPQPSCIRCLSLKSASA